MIIQSSSLKNMWCGEWWPLVVRFPFLVRSYLTRNKDRNQFPCLVIFFFYVMVTKNVHKLCLFDFFPKGKIRITTDFYVSLYKFSLDFRIFYHKFDKSVLHLSKTVSWLLTSCFRHRFLDWDRVPAGDSLVPPVILSPLWQIGNILVSNKSLLSLSDRNLSILRINGTFRGSGWEVSSMVFFVNAISQFVYEFLNDIFYSFRN